MGERRRAVYHHSGDNRRAAEQRGDRGAARGEESLLGKVAELLADALGRLVEIRVAAHQHAHIGMAGEGAGDGGKRTRAHEVVVAHEEAIAAARSLDQSPKVAVVSKV